jgi:hypothetical protein
MSGNLKVRVLRLVLILATALLAVISNPAAQADAGERRGFDRYLAGMSWPLRASVLRAMSASRAIDGVLTYGDPPFLGQVITACEKFRDVEETGRRRGVGAILSIVSPKPIAASHSRLSDAYVEARVRCARAERLAIAALKAGNRSNWTASGGTTAKTRAGLREFDRITLRRFFGAVRTWRSAMLREAAALRLQPPRWLRRLDVNRRQHVGGRAASPAPQGLGWPMRGTFTPPRSKTGEAAYFSLREDQNVKTTLDQAIAALRGLGI